MQTELARYVASVKTTASGLVGASQNGQSYSFGPRSDLSLQQWQIEIQDALSYFDLADPVPTSNEVVTFSNPWLRRY